jgi:hypothetical protein
MYVYVMSLAEARKGVYIHVLYMHAVKGKGGSRVSAAGDRPRGVVTINNDVPRGRLNGCEGATLSARAQGRETWLRSPAVMSKISREGVMRRAEQRAYGQG